MWVNVAITLVIPRGRIGFIKVVDRFVDMPILDPLFGGAIGLWIIYGSIRLLRLSLTGAVGISICNAAFPGKPFARA